jgi:hypothetical protein
MLRLVIATIPTIHSRSHKTATGEHRISVMGTRTAGLSTEIKALQVELDAEMAKSGVGLRFGLERGRAIFDAELVRLHKQARTSLYRYVIHAHPLVVLTAPLIYTLIVPLVLLDVCVTAVSGNLLSRLRPGKGAARGLSGVRPPPSAPSQCPGKTQLRLLLVRERLDRLRGRNRCPHRGLLVPDQTRAQDGDGARALFRLRRFR